VFLNMGSDLLGLRPPDRLRHVHGNHTPRPLPTGGFRNRRDAQGETRPALDTAFGGDARTLRIEPAWAARSLRDWVALVADVLGVLHQRTKVAVHPIVSRDFGMKAGREQTALPD
jgi:hypothetical protein